MGIQQASKQEELIKEYFKVSSQIFAIQSKTDLLEIRKKLTDLKKSMHRQRESLA